MPDLKAIRIHSQQLQQSHCILTCALMTNQITLHCVWIMTAVELVAIQSWYGKLAEGCYDSVQAS